MYNKRKVYCLLMIVLLLIPITIYAGRGCCSNHGGQNYCDTNTGRWVCGDGTYSPSCTCYNENKSTTSKNNSSSNSYSKNSTTSNTFNIQTNNNTKDDNDSIIEDIGVIGFAGLFFYGIYKFSNSNNKHK